MRLIGKLTVVELKLLSRDVGAVVFGVMFPAVLLLVLGALPGFRETDPELGGASLIELYTPIVLVLSFAVVGVSSVASQLATYRTSGVLRRLRVTPVGPSRLLVAQLAANVTFALAASALAVVAALVVYDVPAPQNWWGFLAGLLLAAMCLFALGLTVGAIAPTTTAAGTIATFIWLPIMVLAGLWFPREAMPDLMRRISDLSPGGAAVDAVQQAWFSGVTPLSSLVVLAVSAVVIGTLAAVTFRWE